MHRLHDVWQFSETSLKHRIVNKTISDGGITVDFLLSKSILLIDHRIAGDHRITWNHGIAGDHRIAAAGIIE